MSRDLPNTMLKHSIGLTLREREREREKTERGGGGGRMACQTKKGKKKNESWMI